MTLKSLQQNFTVRKKYLQGYKVLVIFTGIRSFGYKVKVKIEQVL